jgi:hypothetical protein
MGPDFSRAGSEAARQWRKAALKSGARGSGVADVELECYPVSSSVRTRRWLD